MSRPVELCQLCGRPIVEPLWSVNGMHPSCNRRAHREAQR